MHQRWSTHWIRYYCFCMLNDKKTSSYFLYFPLQENGDPSPITLQEGHSAEIHTAIMDHSRLDFRLLNYLDQDWEGVYSLRHEQEEISFIVFHSLCKEEEESMRAELDIAIHVTYNPGQTVVALHSPYWMVNKTGRLLQYKADDIHRKHPKEYDKPLLFSFKPRNFLHNNKVETWLAFLLQWPLQTQGRCTWVYLTTIDGHARPKYRILEFLPGLYYLTVFS